METRGISQRQVMFRYGFNQRTLTTLLDRGTLTFLPNYSSPLRRKIDATTLNNLIEGKHYVVCRECGAFQSQVTTRHLKVCCGMTLAEYQDIHNAPIMSSLCQSNKAKTEEQRREQSETLKKRFQTPAGEITRQQISESSKKLQASEYGKRAAIHLRRLGKDPEIRQERRERMLERWSEGDLREKVEKWHRDNPQKSRSFARKSRRHVKKKHTKPHKTVKRALLEAGLEGFQTEFEVGYYSIDEACPDLKLAVEVDGCYWHGCEKCGHEGRPETKAVDARKETYLTRKGWKVIRLPEHAVRDDLQGCVQRVIAAVEECHA